MKKGTAITLVERDWLQCKAKDLPHGGTTISDVKALCDSSDIMTRYVQKKWPGLSQKEQCVRLRDILRKFRQKEHLSQKY